MTKSAPFHLRDHRGLAAQRGLTLIEVTLMLTVTMAIVAALLPTMTATIRHAEVARALADMTAIATQMDEAYNNDMNQEPTIDGDEDGTRVEILVSDGDIPREVSATGSAEWQRPVDNIGGLVDFLERHLVTNNPRGNPANAYSTGGGDAWRGAYLTAPIDPDPWGNRYAVNTEFYVGGNDDVVVLSAGPDEQIDSLYEDNGLNADDDDLVVLVDP
jgi:type II secretory pathway pseudopilin PulG